MSTVQLGKIPAPPLEVKGSAPPLNGGVGWGASSDRRFRETFQNKKGTHCYEVYKDRTEKCPVCVVEKTFRDGQSHRIEETWICQDGSVVEVIVYTTPICDGRGKIVAVMEMSTNITEIRRLQSQLESLGILVGSISHGIKGLLTGLDGGAYFLRSGLERDDMERVRKG